MPGSDSSSEPPLTPQEKAELKRKLKEVEKKIAIVQERQKQKEIEKRKQERSKWIGSEFQNFAVYFWRKCDNHRNYSVTVAKLKEELRLVEEKIAAEKQRRDRQK